VSILEQVSFTSGEISPSLYARTDLARYQSAVKKLLNFIPMQYGGVRNRAGFKAIPCAFNQFLWPFYAYGSPKMIPFSRSENENIIIIVGWGAFRFIKNGELVTLPKKPITGVTNASVAVVTCTAHGYSNGDKILITGVSGLSQVNNREFYISNKTTNTFELYFYDRDLSLQAVDSTNYGAYINGGGAYKIYEVANDYEAAVDEQNDEAAVDEQNVLIDYVQSVDLMILTHEKYPPKYLRYFGDTNWTHGDYQINRGAFQAKNTTNNTVVYDRANNRLYSHPYGVFSDYNIGQYIELETNDFGVAWGAGVAVGVGDIRRAGDHFYKSLSLATTGSLRPTWTSGSGSDGGVEWQYVHSGKGIAKITSFVSIREVVVIEIETIPEGCNLGARTPSNRWSMGAFGGNQGYPKAVNFYQERLVFGGTKAQPETVFTSSVGAYDDFGTSSPLKDDDALTFTIAGRKLNKIKFIEGVQDLLCFTSSGENLIAGGSNYVLTPSTLSVRPQSNYGCAEVKPVLVGSNVVFVHQNGSTLLDMGFSADSAAQSGLIADDITLLANHLFLGKNIIRLMYQQSPDNVLWALRDDGVLLSCTYLRSQQVVAWAQHTTDGIFRDVCVIQENGKDRLYAIVERNGIGSVEVLADRDIATIYDSFFVDSGYSYDGFNTTIDKLKITNGTAWDETETLTVIASTIQFAVGDIGKYVFFYGDNIVVKCLITAYTDRDEVSVIPDRTIPLAMRDTFTTTWSIALKTVGGLWMLNGKTVSILANGNVDPQQVVTNGKITLQSPSDRLCVGLPYVSDLETLRINVIGSREGTTQTKQKLINKVSLICQDTRGLFAGADADNLREYRPPKRTTYEDPLELQSGLFEQAIASSYDKQGSILVRQSDPLPVTILSIIPEITVGGA